MIQKQKSQNFHNGSDRLKMFTNLKVGLNAVVFVIGLSLINF